jgi:hypothetical protein
MKLKFNFYFNTVFLFFSFCIFLLSTGSAYAGQGDYCDAYIHCNPDCPCDDQGNTVWCNQQTGTCEQTCGDCSCSQCGGTLPPWPACTASNPPDCVRTRDCTCGGYYQINNQCCVADEEVTPPTCTAFSTVKINSCSSWTDYLAGSASCITQTRSVSLNVTSPNATSVSLDLNPVWSPSCGDPLAYNFFGSALPYSPPSMSYGVTLPPGNGAKKICAKLTNSLGSAICGGTITLAAPPSCASMQNAMINTCDAASWTAGASNCTTSSPNVNFNFVGVTDVSYVSFDLNPVWATNCGISNAFSGSYPVNSVNSVTLPSTFGDKKVTLQA